MRMLPQQHPHAARAVLAIIVSLLVIALTRDELLQPAPVRRFELATIDYRYHARGTRPHVADSSSIIIVEISEDALKSLPATFPWPRSYYARLLRNLNAAGAHVVGVDLIFSGSDVADGSQDEEFRSALRETGIAVLAGKREEDRSEAITASMLENYGNIFFDTDSALGLVNIRPDNDGIYRLYNPYFVMDRPEGDLPAARARGVSAPQSVIEVPTFAFAVLNRYFGLEPFTTPRQTSAGFEYHGRTIPRYDAASMLINFVGPHRTFRHVSFQDVLDDSSFTTAEEEATGEEINTFSDPEYGYLHDGTFRDRIVLVGVTVPEYKDVFPVALGRGERTGDNLMYGVEIHANVIESVLRNEFLSAQSLPSHALMVLLLAALALFVASWIKSLKLRYGVLLEILGVCWVAILAAAAVGASMFLFTHERVVVSMTGALGAIVGGYGASTLYHLVSERRQRLLIKSMFSTYLNPSVVDELIAHPEKLALGGKREELTVIFCDIEGFTTISQHLDPERLVALLNEYLSVMSTIIFRHDGTVDKYEGDAIMAFWGAPVPQPDHALRACRAAIEMQRAAADLDRSWKEQGKPPLRIRIGINTGVMVVGNMGAEGKFDYTVIGDSVNLASRLEGANKEYGTAIMASQRTYELVQNEILARQLDLIAVKGRTEPVTVYELLRERAGDRDARLDRFLELYAEGLRRYFDRRWDDAVMLFEEAARLRPDDQPTRIHLARAREYASVPPPADWNGVFVMRSK